MRDRDQDVADPALQGGLPGRAADQDLRLAVLTVADLDVGPGDAVAPPGSHRLQDRFLGRPAPGEVLDGVLPSLAVADLALGVDAAEEQLAVVLDHLADSRALDDVGADPQDFHAGPPSATDGSGRPRPAGTSRRDRRDLEFSLLPGACRRPRLKRRQSSQMDRGDQDTIAAPKTHRSRRSSTLYCEE